MAAPLNIAIAGLGTVGAGVVKLLKENGPLINARVQRSITIKAVNARSKEKDRGIDLSVFEWVEEAQALAQDPAVDVVVELIGGAEGVAHDLVKAALENGKHVVTANKALIAIHGLELAALAEKKNVCLYFDAAVAGGVPVIHALQHGTTANNITRIEAILNGTCNYILSTMVEEARAFDDVLKQAQDLGYAEADPSTDVDGYDTAHKLAILSTLSFGTKPAYDQIEIEGIANLTLGDLKAAEAQGLKYKLIATAEKTSDGVVQKVAPQKVGPDNPLYHVTGSYSGVILEGDFVGTLSFTGAGAGEGPTASAVVSDIIKIANDIQVRPFILGAASLQ